MTPLQGGNISYPDPGVARPVPIYRDLPGYYLPRLRGWLSSGTRTVTLTRRLLRGTRWHLVFSANLLKKIGALMPKIESLRPKIKDLRRKIKVLQPKIKR